MYYKMIEFVGSAYSLQSSEERLGYIKSKCVNLEIIDYYDIVNVRYIEVRCRLGYMTRYGCPKDCPGFKSLAPTGAGTFAGVVIGGFLGLVGGPLGVLAGAIIGGLLGTAIETGGLLTRFEQLVNDAQSKGMRVVVKPKLG